jgi:formate dehydrogenase iron-sulfur subunit
MPGFLRTPGDWPRIVLERVTPATATGTAASVGDAASWDATAELDTARRAGAFRGLEQAIRDLGSAGTVAAIAASGLRGRGGAGFPTGEKWRTAANQPGARVVVANGYGADPASGTDHALLMADPWAVLEGLLIAAYAVGAHEAIVAVRGEQEAVVTRLRAAVAALEVAGLIGDDIARSGWSVEVAVRPVQGAYMLGEETVLLKALESRRGQPEQRPPHPAQRGLFGRPTVVNNVLTLGTVPMILADGGSAYAALGVGRSRGTQVFQLGGNLARGGIVETAFGITLGELVNGYGGGTASGRPLRAVQVGGPLGAYLPQGKWDTVLDYEAFAGAGGMIGHGGIVVFDDTVDMAAQARYAMEFCAIESCGKCTPCRIGSVRGSEVVDRIVLGGARAADTALLRDLCDTMVNTSLCAMGGLTPMPVLSALDHFPEDFAKS